MPKRKPVFELCNRQLRRLKQNYASSGETLESVPSDVNQNFPDSECGTEEKRCLQRRSAEGKVGCEGICSSESETHDQHTELVPACELCQTCSCLHSCEECYHRNGKCCHCTKCSNGFLDEGCDSDPEVSDSDSVSDSENGRNECSSASGSSGDEFTEALIVWALTFSISLVALSNLLKILRLLRPDLPLDGRTLLKTPRDTKVRDVAPGLYWHCGLISSMRRLLQGTELKIVKFSIGIDGLPISRSSGSCLWPILCSVRDYGIFIIGAFHGTEKPCDSNLFLREFIEEAVELVSKGLTIGKNHVTFLFDKLICDAPAKSFVLKVKGHSGRSSCTRCTTEGEYIQHRMSFPEITATKRSDESFRSQCDSEHHVGSSDLLLVPEFGPVSSVVLDYMHLICLGVVRKLLYFWIGGKLIIRLSSSKISQISNALETFASFVPHEFVRKSRSLKFVKLWKATEYRQFLLYTGPIALCDVLPKPLFENFMSLHVAVLILCSEQFCKTDNFLNYADSLLRHFVENFLEIYGKEFISHNVHNLVHVVDDVRMYGHLDSYSVFPFENFLHEIKGLVRKGDKPLAQLARRYSEKYIFKRVVSVSPDDEIKYLNSHSSGILTVGCTSPQYKCIKLANFILSLNTADSCCEMSDGHIVCVENFCYSIILKSMVILGRCFKEKTDLYMLPCPSSSFGIFKVKTLSHILVWPVKFVARKLLKLPIGQHSYAVFPLLHT